MILRPATPEELAHSLRAANGSRARVSRVELSSLTRVIEHTPEDMTATVETGCTLAALQRALAARGQWLPIDPPNAGRLTLGELLDHNSNGPRRCGFGTIRDWVIGLRVALADGRLIRNGGKVVKNVAGYDLMKLFIGARGTLGVIVEATFKLLPLPEAEAFAQARCETLDAAEALITRVLDSELTPIVFDLHNGSTVQPFNHSTIHVVLGFSGCRAAVDWQLGVAAGLGFDEPATLQYDELFHAPDLPRSEGLSVLPSRLVETLRGLGEVHFIARAANGVIHHRQPERRTPVPQGEESTRAKSEPGARTLMNRVKQTFDPNGVFSDLSL